MKKFIYLIISGAIAFSCTSKNWTSGPEGVTVFPSNPSGNGAQAIRIVPVTGEIIGDKKMRNACFGIQIGFLFNNKSFARTR